VKQGKRRGKKGKTNQRWLRPEAMEPSQEKGYDPLQKVDQSTSYRLNKVWEKRGRKKRGKNIKVEHCKGGGRGFEETPWKKKQTKRPADSDQQKNKKKKKERQKNHPFRYSQRSGERCKKKTASGLSTRKRINEKKENSKKNSRTFGVIGEGKKTRKKTNAVLRKKRGSCTARNLKHNQWSCV